MKENKMMFTNKIMGLEDAKFMGDLFRCGTPPNMYYDATMLVLKENGEHELLEKIEKRHANMERTLFMCNVEDMLGTQDRYGMCGIEDADGVLTLA
jgi:hypothetical protein